MGAEDLKGMSLDSVDLQWVEEAYKHIVRDKSKAFRVVDTLLLAKILKRNLQGIADTGSMAFFISRA